MACITATLTNEQSEETEQLALEDAESGETT